MKLRWAHGYEVDDLQRTCILITYQTQRFSKMPQHTRLGCRGGIDRRKPAGHLHERAGMSGLWGEESLRGLTCLTTLCFFRRYQLHVQTTESREIRYPLGWFSSCFIGLWLSRQLSSRLRQERIFFRI